MSCLLLCLGTFQILRGPLNISNATLGGSARFECIINDEDVAPRWNIARRDYDVATLPNEHSYQQNSFSKVLTVSPLQQQMNNTYYYCYIFSLLTGRLESSRAKLIIRSTPVHFSSWQFTESATSASSPVHIQKSTSLGHNYPVKVSDHDILFPLPTTPVTVSDDEMTSSLIHIFPSPLTGSTSRHKLFCN